MSKKLKIHQLEVSSFVTENKTHQIKGGTDGGWATLTLMHLTSIAIATFALCTTKETYETLTSDALSKVQENCPQPQDDDKK